MKALVVGSNLSTETTLADERSTCPLLGRATVDNTDKKPPKEGELHPMSAHLDVTATSQKLADNLLRVTHTATLTTDRPHPGHIKGLRITAQTPTLTDKDGNPKELGEVLFFNVTGPADLSHIAGVSNEGEPTLLLAQAPIGQSFTFRYDVLLPEPIELGDVVG